MFEEQNITLDPFQEMAIECVEANQSVLVAAPTGTGKTLIAEYLIKKSLTEGRGVIYTAPVKAPSNQKYREFEKLFPGKVGIITGDVSINPHASLLIMTTEIFRNKVLEKESSLENHSWIIFDEIHYLDNVERGTVWEESLIFMPRQMRFLGLSATIPNVDQFADWLREIHQTKIHVIKEYERPVPLHYLFQSGNKIHKSLEDLRSYAYGKRKQRYFKDGGSPEDVFIENDAADLIAHLAENDRLPCMYFVFSRKRCEKLATEVSGMGFLTPEERTHILELFDDFCMRYAIDDEDRVRNMRELVGKGVAYHHAGIQPMLKEIVERLFSQKLIKLIFATETFALGINMPARTVVMDEVKKKYGRFFRALKVRDFFQMAGRSGRRGIDTEGFVYSRVNSRQVSYRELESIFVHPPENIRSRFHASYATILNLYETYGERLMEMYGRSFHYYQLKQNAASHELVKMEARLDILIKLGYIHDGALTEKGHFAKKMHGCELPMAELYGYGVLEELTTSQLGILALAAVFEPRPGVKKIKYGDEIRNLEKMTTQAVRGIHRFEKKMGISYLSKRFFYDLSASIMNWMDQMAFSQLVEVLKIDEGEVIRYFRMSLQVLREMLETPASETLKQNTLRAIELIDRGVIDAEAQLK
ncbi:MAG: DEAD/DEAH box helicase, partial [bacterium]|nr:DEAD/DEAH box helicase [bacterium]